MEKVFYEVFEEMPRQGPGDNESTKRAFGKIIGVKENPSVLDIGCGTGMQTLLLSRLTDGKITAVDNHKPFIDLLKKKIAETGAGEKIEALIGDMGNLPFLDESFDIIWSEGSVFIIGFENGLGLWKRLLKRNGYLVISDLVWFKRNPPEDAVKFFSAEGANVTYYEDLFKVIASAGYELKDSFRLPDESWWTYFYAPMLEIVERKRIEHRGDKKSEDVLDMLQLEAEIHKKYREFYGYSFFVMKKP